MSDARDSQVGGDHYTRYPIQPWDAMEAWLSYMECGGYLRASIIAYLVRYRDKGGVDDLRKAAHYLQKLIDFETKENADE